MLIKELYEDFGDLRACQRAACISAYSHFITNIDPALLSLPTGSGKTVVIALLHLLFESKSTLVITPTTILREQTSKKLDRLNELKQFVSWPTLNGRDDRSQEVSNLVKSSYDWDQITTASFTVLTPKVISPYYSDRGVASKPEGTKIDLVVVDEAHHSAAPSWKRLLEHFEGTKIVMLTASPFRLDKRPIPGRSIYIYPIARAFQDEIYRSLTYIEVKGAEDSTEKNTIEAAKTEFTGQSKFMVRTNRIDEADRLAELYDEHGFDTFLLHSKLDEIKQKESLDGFRESLGTATLIVVDMASEGLDLPDLDGIVLHDAPKTLPPTLQLVGRLSRTNKNKNPGKIVCSRDVIWGPASQLYNSGHDDWQGMLGDLFDKLFTDQNASKVQSPGVGIDIMKDCNPISVAHVYKIEDSKDVEWPAHSDFNTNSITEDGWEIEATHQETDLLIITTIKYRKPTWMNSLSAPDVIRDFHFFYCSGKYLFEVSTDRNIGLLILDAILNSVPHVGLGASDLSKFCGGVDRFVSAGVKSFTNTSAKKATFKAHFGSRVTTTFPTSDRFLYFQEFASGVEGKTIKGFSVSKSKIWQLKVHDIPSLKQWCEGVGEVLNSRKHNNLLKAMNTAKAIEIKSFTKRRTPINIQIPLEACSKYCLFVDEEKIFLDEIEFRIVSFNAYILTISVLKGNLVIGKGKFSIKTRKWTFDESKIRIRDIVGVGIPRTFDYFFNRNLPIVFLKNGQAIAGQNNWEPNCQDYSHVFDSCYLVDWSNVDIRAETPRDANKKRKNPSIDGNTVIDRTFRFLDSDKSKIFIAFDDGTAEFADLVAVNNLGEIELYHCKYSSDEKPGTRVGDCYEVLGQAMRSIDKLFRPAKSFEILSQRVSDKKASILRGRKVLNEITNTDLKVSTGTVYIVQPGLSLKKLRAGIEQTRIKGILSNLLSTIGWIESHGFKCKFWISE